jgi:hypothetical protein
MIVTLFHVTFLMNLRSIAERGLELSSGSNFSPAYTGHSRGRIFLTEADGVAFWAHRLENIAGAVTDHPEEGWVPVVVVADINEADISSDPLGTNDALAEAYFVTKPVPVKSLTYFDRPDFGGPFELVDIADADPDAMMEDVLKASEFIGEEGLNEDDGFWEIDYEYFLPPVEEMEDLEES